MVEVRVAVWMRVAEVRVVSVWVRVAESVWVCVEAWVVESPMDSQLDSYACRPAAMLPLLPG